MTFDIVIHNGTLVTVDADFRVIEGGLICIRDGVIAKIAAAPAGAPPPPAAETIDAAGGMVLPGLVNAHTHLPMTLFRGLADDLPLAVWLNEHMFPAEARHIRADTVRAGALLACAELILSGATTCCDGYFFEGQVAEVVCRSGLRAILGHGLLDFPAPGVPDPARNLSVALAFVEEWRNAVPRIAPSIFCHSPYTCSAATLKKAKAAAAADGLLFQIHVSETRAEFDRSIKEHGRTPVEYLDSLGLLDPATLLVHAVWLKDSDIALLAERGAAVAIATESEMKLASGIAPLPRLLSTGIAVGLGTDGSASNNDLDLFQEMDVTAKLHKVNALDPTLMDAASVLKLATIGAAKAIGRGHEIGSLEVGKQADVIVVDTRKPHLQPIYNPVSHLVYCARGADVRDVVVAGKVLLRNRKLLTLDLEEIFEDVAVIGRRIKDDSGRQR